MAFASSNLKLTQVQGVIRCSGANSDTGTIDIDVDLALSSETPSSPRVNITRLHWYCDKNASVTVSRNGVTIAHLHDVGYTDWYGFVENTENDQDIDIDFHNGNAVLIIEVNKVSGFGNEQHLGAGGLD
jgi:hypothetical protein